MVPKTAQDGPKTATRRPKVAQESPKMAQDSAKMAPRWHQESPKSSQGPKCLSRSFSLPRNPSNLGAKNVQKRGQERDRKVAKSLSFFSEIGSWSVSGASQKWFREGGKGVVLMRQRISKRRPALCITVIVAGTHVKTRLTITSYTAVATCSY